MAQDQAVEFLFAAHTQGMQDVAKLATAVDGLRKETERLKTANAGLASSTDAVIQNGKRYNNAIDAQSKALRQHRQGVQQLGMQFNDFATSVTTGASPLQAFSQQLGQVGYAMSMMGGMAGTVGSFLAGPWGALLLVGVSVAATFAGQLLNTGDAAAKAGKDFQSAADDARNLIGAMNALNLNKKRMELNKLTEEQFQLESRLGQLQAANKSGKDKLGIFALPSTIMTGAAKRATEDALYQVKLQVAETKNLISIADKENSAVESKAKSHEKSAGSVARHTNALKANNDAIRERLKLDKFASEIIAKSDVSLAERMDKMSQTQLAFAPTVDALKASNEFDKIQTRNDEIRKSFESIGTSVNDAFKGMLTAGMSWKDGMKGIIGAVIDELWRMYVVQQIVGFVTKTISGAIGGGIPSDVSGGVALADKMFGTTQFGATPGFANGTMSAPGGLAWVGERGPELVNLPRGSQVIPAHRASQMGGGGAVINVDARGSSDPAAVREQVRAGIIAAAPSIIAAAEARTVAGLRRPRLGGAMQ